MLLYLAKSRELGRLDPNLYLSETNEDLYDVPMDHLGRVWFTISYDEAAEQLRITIHKARNLRPPHLQSFRTSTAITSNDMASLSVLTPAPTQDCRIRSKFLLNLIHFYGNHNNTINIIAETRHS